MVFPEMLCGIAFVGGCLLTLALMPLIHKRAVRVTRRHIIGMAPASMDDIRAERDRSRAQFAIAIRSLETSVRELSTKSASQSSEVGRQAAEIQRLEAELHKRASRSAEFLRQAAEIHRLQAELKKRAALVSVLRVRGQAQHAVT